MDGRVFREYASSGFAISFTHSVNRGRVYDFYAATPEGGLLLKKTRFTSYGAGMPDPQAGQTFIKTDEYYEIGEINIKIQKLVLRTGVIADHRMQVCGEEIVFNDFLPKQTQLTIQSLGK